MDEHSLKNLLNGNDPVDDNLFDDGDQEEDGMLPPAHAHKKATTAPKAVATVASKKTPSPDDPDLITAREATKLAHRSKTWPHVAADAGRILRFKLPGVKHLLFSRQSVLEEMARAKVRDTAKQAEVKAISDRIDVRNGRPPAPPAAPKKVGPAPKPPRYDGVILPTPGPAFPPPEGVALPSDDTAEVTVNVKASVLGELEEHVEALIEVAGLQSLGKLTGKRALALVQQVIGFTKESLAKLVG